MTLYPSGVRVVMRSRERFLCLLLFAGSSCFIPTGAAQLIKSSDLDLAKRLERSPKLPFREEPFPFHAPSSSWEMGPVSGVAVGRNGTIYVIQRGSKADPILA